MRYIRPNSLTWWAGVLATSSGTSALILPHQEQLSALAQLVSMLAGAGDTSPLALISLGLGLIGLRDRIERGFRQERR
ncbi:MAG: hypothetical protein HRU11_15620 [Parvularculaceae bacterium]|nr:hypothetical protein [Parvularculaceae bacterium]